MKFKNIIISLLTAILYLHSCTHVSAIDAPVIVGTLGMWAIVYGMCYFMDIWHEDMQERKRLKSKIREFYNIDLSKEKGRARG